MVTKRLVGLLLLGAMLGFWAAEGRAADILFISSMDPVHMPGEDQLKAFMEGMGHTVTYFDDNETEAATEAAAAAADMVFISESVSSGNIRNEITEIATPMVTTEAWAWDEMGLTSGGGAGQEVVTTDLVIVAPGHPLAAGLTGTVPVLTALASERGAARFGNGIAGPEATVIARATLADGVTYDVVFVYDKGAALPVAPADGSPRFAADIRVCLGFDEQSYLVWNENAYALLRAAINYALGMRPTEGAASRPDPANGATDVLREAALSWTPGASAVGHDVYFGTVLDDVNDASRTNPLGVLVSQAQDANAYDPPGLLELGRTYYWRIDEVEAPPDGTVVKGAVWCFTTEPLAYPIESVTVTASSFQSNDLGPERTIDGSGLDAGDRHSTAEKAMWLSDPAGSQPTWIQYEFDAPRKLWEMWVWNYNSSVEMIVGFGLKDVTVEYSVNGADWVVLKDVQFAQGSARDGYVHNTTMDLEGVVARYIRLTARSNWGGYLPQYGLSEVRFLHVAVQSRYPVPDDGATEVGVDAVLGWRAGSEAASHQVHFSTDRQAVVDGTALVATIEESSYDPGPLDFGRTYFWRVDEVNEAETPSVWEGEVWSFSTAESFIVDDFETYTDDEGNRIYQTWIDGWVNETGSQVGYVEAPFAERIIIHDGKQSMPFDYNNADSPYYSEAVRTWETPQDWTGNGADTLMLAVRGNPLRFEEPAPGAVVMSGAGVDIWDTADQFTFAWKRLSGNGSIVARVDSIENTNPWAKAGVMIRTSLDPDAKNAMAYVTPDGRVGWQFRLIPVGTSDSTRSEPGAVTLPHWLRLTRTGNLIRAEHSVDGAKWEPMVEAANPAEPTAREIAMDSTVFVGLAVTSHQPDVGATAAFSDASAGGASGSWQFAEIGVDHLLNDRSDLYVALQDKAGRLGVVKHADPDAVLQDDWRPWHIPLTDFSGAGVNLAAITKMYIGVGDRTDPRPDGTGLVFIDGIGVGHPIAAE